MEDKALARPLLLTKGVNFTKLVVDRVSALDQRAYNMLFIGTGSDRGTLTCWQRKQIQSPASEAQQRFPDVFPVPWARVCPSLLLFAEAMRADGSRHGQVLALDAAPQTSSPSGRIGAEFQLMS